ncbi:Stp1/IreP family PP2C-type Ser/Thr phosphatase [candidate division KSB1 bacterium]|nr:Stp1/IreP family PP2C-type Ser/Thr phosphatase [candidate division KSB1 bacterium]
MNRKLTITVGNRTDLGLTRSENQDSLGKFPENSTDLAGPLGQLFIVADGMGGHRGGREASQTAVRIIQDIYSTNKTGDIDEVLEDALREANREIFKLASSDPNLFGMGTTCTVLSLVEDEACIAHVGDSRAYRINESTFEQLTQDHSQVGEMERQGIISQQEAKEHPQRFLLNRALGAREDVEVDIYKNIKLTPGDYFLLCSDGLAKVDDQELKQAVLSNPPQQACDQLVKLANERGGEDNVTVQVIQVEGAS